MLSLKDSQEKIAEAIDQLKINGTPAELYEPIQYILSIGGKRMRPALVLMACNLYSADVDAALNVALAIEVFHNFTLLHDDIMDDADVRRNMATVHKKWNNNAAILSGDAMLIKAYQLLERMSGDIQPEVFHIFNKTALEVCEGQQLDMNFETRHQVTVDEYVQMISLKTAVLVAASLKIGALIGGAPAEEADKMYAFGLNLGLAFQIQDDFLDAYANEEEFGKARGGDIVANKKTFLLITALQKAGGEVKNELAHWLALAKFDREEKVKTIIRIYELLGVPALTQQKIREFHHLSIQALDSVNVDSAAKEPLYQFTEYLMERNT